MELPIDISSVMQNAARYFMLHGQEIPAYQREKIVSLMGPGVSPVDFIVCISEALYAIVNELDNEGKEIVAQAANLAALNGWHGMTERGNQIVNAMKRRTGEEIVGEDPAPNQDFMEPILPEPVDELILEDAVEPANEEPLE